MTLTLSHTLLSFRDLLATTVPFALLAIALLTLACWVLDPAPPRRVALATGTEQGAYAEFGKRYAELLKTYGIRVELRGTQGAAENLQPLRDPNAGVDIALVIPLWRMLPPLYQFRIRSRIVRWYAQRREVELAVGRRPTDHSLTELAAIEARVEGVSPPLSYSDEPYSLRSHSQMVGQRLRES